MSVLVQVENLRFLFAIPISRHFAPDWTGWNKQKQVLIIEIYIFIYLQVPTQIVQVF